MRIISNHQWRDFTYRYDVPASVLADQFDYQDAEEALDGFFCYRGCWYHLDGFMRSESVPGYDGFAADSFFSGVAIKVSSDGEQYQVATVIA